jgi:SAM-dependent methyltransferase
MKSLHTDVRHDNWEQHWASYSDGAERNPAQRYRRQLICKLMSVHGCSDASRILDLGSGQGDLARDLRAAFPKAEIAGIELSAAGVAMASAKVPGARFFQQDLLEPTHALAAPRSWANYAACSEVLEHLDDPALFLANASEYLAPGGTLVVTVPGGPMSQFDRHIGHRRHYDPQAVRTILENNGFTVDLATTAGFPFFNLYRSVVILRGSSLIADVNTNTRSVASLLARAVMALFRPLFALNLFGTRLGWQTVAVARLRSPALSKTPISPNS